RPGLSGGASGWNACHAGSGPEAALNTDWEASMTDSALIIQWGATAPGRERKAVELFGESLRFLTSLVTKGRVASVEPFFLQPHGGNVEGFFIMRGDRDELNKIRGEDDFQRYS